MIEFKGAFYKDKTMPSQSVLVQFDGVLLHIWHMSNPFHRILSSDVFDLPSSMGRRKHYIKLPNGCRIETDDLQALSLLQSNRRPRLTTKLHGIFPLRRGISVAIGLVAALTAGLFAYWLFAA
jgi:hypothetical protein